MIDDDYCIHKQENIPEGCVLLAQGALYREQGQGNVQEGIGTLYREV